MQCVPLMTPDHLVSCPASLSLMSRLDSQSVMLPAVLVFDVVDFVLVLGVERVWWCRVVWFAAAVVLFRNLPLK